jgi:hypothetical protein
MIPAVAAYELHGTSGAGHGVDVLAGWAESLGGRAARRSRGRLRFVFYGRVSTEDWQDPVTSRARQLQQAAMLVAGHGVIVAEFFDVGESRTLPWARRPQAVALVAALADPDRGWDAVVIGEYERAFYASQYASMAPLFEHYDVGLWMPEVGGRESAWSNGKSSYRCRHSHTSATHPDPRRPKNAYIREAQILPHLAALAILLGGAQKLPRGTRQVTAPGEATGLIDQLRTAGITLTYDPDTRSIRTGDSDVVAVTACQDR